MIVIDDPLPHPIANFARRFAAFRAACDASVHVYFPCRSVAPTTPTGSSRRDGEDRIHAFVILYSCSRVIGVCFGASVDDFFCTTTCPFDMGISGNVEKNGGIGRGGSDAMYFFPDFQYGPANLFETPLIDQTNVLFAYCYVLLYFTSRKPRRPRRPRSACSVPLLWPP